MENQQSLEEDDIDLRKYIEIILKRKMFVLAVFFIAVIIAASLSFNTPKAYRATATIMITPSAIQSALSPNKGLLDTERNDTGDDKGSLWNISIATHLSLLKSNLVLERIIGKLKLSNASGKEVRIEDLSKRMNISNAGDSIVQLEVTAVNPEEAKDTANVWAEQYVEYSQELILGEVKGVDDFVMSQFEISKKNLSQTEELVNNFKKEYKQDLMSADLKMKKNALNKYKMELTGMGMVLKTKEDTLVELKKQIVNQKEFIVLSKAITDDALWQASTQEDDIAELEKKGLRTQIINPIYQNLEMRIVNGEINVNTLNAKEEYLKKSVESLTGEIKELDNTIIQKNFELSQLTGQADIFKKTYIAFSNKIEEAHIIKAAQLGEVKIVSPAIVPDSPESQGKLKKMALAGILGLMLGIFLAFFMEFWQKGKKV